MLPPMGLQRDRYDLVTEQQKQASLRMTIWEAAWDIIVWTPFILFYFFGDTMQHLRSLIRDRTCAPCIRNMES